MFIYSLANKALVFVVLAQTLHSTFTDFHWFFYAFTSTMEWFA